MAKWKNILSASGPPSLPVGVNEGRWEEAWETTKPKAGKLLNTICAAYNALSGINSDAETSVLHFSSVHPAVAQALWHDRDCQAFFARKGNLDGLAPLGRTVVLRNLRNHDGLPGLSPDRIQITVLEGAVNFDHNLIDQACLARLKDDAKRRGRPEAEDNDIKFSLYQVEPTDIEDFDQSYLELLVKKTDYYTVTSVVETIAKDGYRRQGSMSCMPSKNYLPSSLCAHLIVRFANGTFLLLHRNPDAPWEGDKVSFSIEEQLKAEDLLSPLPVKNWIYRAVAEEVYPKLKLASGQRAQRLDALSEMDNAFQSTAILAVILEEKYANFALLAFVQLTITASEYLTLLREAIKDGRRPDDEGRRYLMTDDSLRLFFERGWALASNVGDGSELVVAIPGEHVPHRDYNELHATSLARMDRTARLLGML